MSSKQKQSVFIDFYTYWPYFILYSEIFLIYDVLFSFFVRDGRCIASIWAKKWRFMKILTTCMCLIPLSSSHEKPNTVIVCFHRPHDWRRKLLMMNLTTKIDPKTPLSKVDRWTKHLNLYLSVALEGFRLRYSVPVVLS